MSRRKPYAAGYFLRVQQINDGRGPFRSGFTERWLSPDNPHTFPAGYDEFGWEPYQRIPSGWYSGHAFENMDQLYSCFTAKELVTLKKYGFHIVSIGADLVLGRSENQVLFARRKPLAEDVSMIPTGELELFRAAQ